MIANSRILLIISGGIAAYKCLDLIRCLRRKGAEVQPILTKGGAEFVTPLSVATIAQRRGHQDLFSLTDESEMGHIELSRDAELLVAAPATADIIAKMRAGIADDLATTVLLATNKPIMIAPAMNVQMWGHAATQDNVEVLKTRGVNFIGPEEGDMACGEYGMGRMTEPHVIANAVVNFFQIY